MIADSPDQPPQPKPPQKRRPGLRRAPEGEEGGGRGGIPPIALILLFGLLLLLVWNWQSSPANFGTTVRYTFFLEQLEKNNVEWVKINRPYLSGKWKVVPDPPEPLEGEGERRPLEAEFNAEIPSLEDRTLLTRLEEHGVPADEENANLGVMSQLFIWTLPLLLVMGFFLLMMRRSADPMSSGMFGNFVRSPAKRFKPDEQHNTFDDVAGMESAKRELEEVVDFLKNPAKFQRLGAQIPKGVLLMGSPGTGKTLLARATAGEAGVPFFSINGSEFIQMFVGVGASRVRDMFRTAKEAAPCILFIDEIDAVGRVRGAGVGGGHDEREQTLNQILSEMDGFQQNEAVIVIAATNRPDVLDPALLRPGRFDRHVAVERPTREGRVGILKVHCRRVPLADDVRLEDVAAGTIGFSGADLKNLVNEAALNATREGHDAVTMDDFDAARDRIIMGAKREEVLGEHERQMLAYHEAGHALLAWLLPHVDPVHKVTIVPRGRALGVTQMLPDEESYSIGEKRLHDQLGVMLGGRAAERLVFDESSANAEDDLKRATQLARRMVGRWGMSDRIGPVAFRDGEEHPFLGREMHEQRQYSDATAHIIDEEVQRFLRDAAQRAEDLLAANREKLDNIVKALLEQEIVTREQLTELIGPATDRARGWTKASSNGSPSGSGSKAPAQGSTPASGEE